MEKVLPPFTRDPETNSKFAPENRVSAIGKDGSYSNHPFLGAIAVSFRVPGNHGNFLGIQPLDFKAPVPMSPA